MSTSQNSIQNPSQIRMQFVIFLYRQWQLQNVCQGRSRDFFRDTHNSPNHFAPPPPPPEKKLFLIKDFGYAVSLTVFFCIWNDISNLWNTLSGVWVHLLMHVNHLSYSLCRGGSVHRLLSCNKAPYFSGFVTLFFDTGIVSSLLSRCSVRQPVHRPSIFFSKSVECAW